MHAYFVQKSRKSCHVINTQDLAEREVEAWPSPTVPQPLNPPTSVAQPQSPPSVPQPGPPTVCQPGGQVPATNLTLSHAA